jgi:hypothetical protein
MNSKCPGVLGDVEYNAQGDRLSAIELYNYDLGANPTSTGLWVPIHRWDETSGLSPVYPEVEQIVYSGGASQIPSDGVGVSTAATASGVLSIEVLITAGAGVVGLLLIIFVLIRKDNAKRMKAAEEAVMHVDEKLRHNFNWKIKTQLGWLAFEMMDATGDIAKPVVLAVAGTMVNRKWLLAACFVVAALSIYQAFVAVKTRRIAIAEMKGILDGELLTEYAEAMHGKDEVDLDNLMVQLDVVTLDLALEDMCMKGALIESIPSLSLFCVEIYLLGVRGISVISLVNALMSVAVIGRKSYLPVRQREMREIKRDIEEQIRDEELRMETESKGDSQLNTVSRRKMSLCAQVLGEDFVRSDVAARQRSGLIKTDNDQELSHSRRQHTNSRARAFLETVGGGIGMSELHHPDMHAHARSNSRTKNAVIHPGQDPESDNK